MTIPDRFYERALYVGIAFAGILYGVILCIGFTAIHYLLKRRRASWRSQLFTISYVVIMLVCFTFAYVANAYMGQLMWIEHRDFPGGPYVYYLAKSTLWINVLGSATDILANILGDAYLLYRCYIIWDSSVWVIAFPTLVYIASVVFSLISLVESALPNSSFFVQQTINFAVPWVSLTVGLNVILTCLISYRILRVRYCSRKAMDGFDGPTRDIYTSVVAILIEAELPFAVLGIVTAVNSGKNTYVSSAWYFIWGSFAIISPLLIILRVCMGKGWTRETSTQMMSRSITFANHFTEASHVETGPTLGPSLVTVGEASKDKVCEKV
ncbi:hypothetical protein OF83DRAFT_706170 [Amylostereum chailletii]|nr:hypothetical protein OF83DRAFT_706170 [Amylostereum chailletii]